MKYFWILFSGCLVAGFSFWVESKRGTKTRSSSVVKPFPKTGNRFWDSQVRWIEVLSKKVERFLPASWERGYPEKLKGCGLTTMISPKNFWAFKCLLGVEGVGIGVLFFFFFSWGISPFLGGLLGFFYPDFWLWREKKARFEQASCELPLVMDMLALCVEAGLDLLPAMQKVVHLMPQSILGRELKLLFSETERGFTRMEALERLAARLPLPAIKTLAVHLNQNIRLGSVLAPVLVGHAKKLRSERLQRAEKAGIYAAQKMLFPIAFCLMPAVFLVVLGPILIRWMQGDFGGL